MRADGGVRHDALGGLGPCLLAEQRGIQSHPRDLVQQRPVAHDLGDRVHRESQLLGTP